MRAMKKLSLERVRMFETTIYNIVLQNIFVAGILSFTLSSVSTVYIHFILDVQFS